MEDFNAYLEEVMDLKKEVTIKFKAVDGGISIVRGHIISMDEVSGRHMIETDAGLVIGVDQIVEVNGRNPENYC